MAGLVPKYTALRDMSQGVPIVGFLHTGQGRESADINKDDTHMITEATQ